jgi:hypothetical protein
MNERADSSDRTKAAVIESVSITTLAACSSIGEKIMMLSASARNSRVVIGSSSHSDGYSICQYHPCI